MAGAVPRWRRQEAEGEVMKFEHDPVKYREMSEPKTEEQAQADAEEFTRGVYELREKLKIADVTIGMSQPLTSGKTFAATAHRGDLFVCAQLGAAVAKALRANANHVLGGKR